VPSGGVLQGAGTSDGAGDGSRVVNGAEGVCAAAACPLRESLMRTAEACHARFGGRVAALRTTLCPRHCG